MKAASRKLFVLSVFLALDLLGGLGSGPLAAQSRMPGNRAFGTVAEPEAPFGSAQGKPGKARPTSLEPTGGVSLPRLVKFSAVLKDRLGEPRTGIVGVTFALYQDQQGGAPLWLEVQNLELDEQGRYTVLLGATQSGGLPLELFAAGRARWLGIQVQGEEESPEGSGRILLVSVPYALKAGDAETLGGKPASAFVLAEEAERLSGQAQGLTLPVGQAALTVGRTGVSKEQVTGTGTSNFIAKFTSSGANPTVGDSAVFESSSSIGLGTTNAGELSQHRLFVAKDVVWPNDTVNSQLALGGATNPARQLVLGYDTTNNYGFMAAGEQGIGWRNLVLQQNGGNVGIGTRNPDVKLQVHVANPFAGTSIGSSVLTNGSVDIVTTDPQGANIGPILALGGNRATVGSNLGVFGGIRGAKENSTDGHRGGYLGFYTLRAGIDFAERMRITSTGNVGIGTTTPHPLARLTIDSVGTGGILLRGGWRDILVPDTENMQFGHINSDGSVFIERMRLTPAGDFGIGTDTPAEKLDVAGNITASGNLTGSQLVSTVTGGTAPLVVSSTTKVTNLNADFLDGLDSTAFELLANKNAPSGYAGLTAASKLTLAQGQEVWAATDLTTYAAESGIGTTALRATVTSPANDDALAWDGANWVNQDGHARVLCRAATQQIVANSTTETSVFSCSIPANTLGTIRSVRLTFVGEYRNNSAATQTFTLSIKFGATTLYSDVTTAHAIDASSRPVWVELLLANQNATNEQILGGVVSIGTAGLANIGIGDLAADTMPSDTRIFGTAAEDTSLAQTLDVTIQHTAASPQVVFRRKYAVLELM